jgi:hypothetical protein
MHLAITQLQRQPELLLIDGNRFTTYSKIPHPASFRVMANMQVLPQPVF